MREIKAETHSRDVLDICYIQLQRQYGTKEINGVHAQFVLGHFECSSIC